MYINEETHPNIAELLDNDTHNEIVDKIKDFLLDVRGYSDSETLEAIDICYDENNIPATITMDMVAKIVEFPDEFDEYLA